MADSYYELVSSDGTREKLDGVGTLEAAKATAKTVAKLTGQSVELVKTQPIDVDAPAIRRPRTSES